MVCVETYEVPEIAACDGTTESDAEAIALIEQLGLTGQQSLVDTDKGTRFPYRRMTGEELRVYRTLLTEQTPIKTYRDGPIPLRVLQVAAHARDCKLDEVRAFTKLEVWHSKCAEVKDPLLVGIHEPKSYETYFYILARWGDVLLPFAELKAMATKLRFEKIAAQLKEIIAEAQGKLASLTEGNALEMDIPRVSF